MHKLNQLNYKASVYAAQAYEEANSNDDCEDDCLIDALHAYEKYAWDEVGSNHETLPWDGMDRPTGKHLIVYGYNNRLVVYDFDVAPLMRMNESDIKFYRPITIIPD